MRHISVLRDNEILDQIPLPKGWKDVQVQDIDELLRKLGFFTEDEEIAITEEID